MFRNLPTHPSKLKTKKCLVFLSSSALSSASVFPRKKENPRNDTTEVEKNVIEEVIALELLCPSSPHDSIFLFFCVIQA